MFAYTWEIKQTELDVLRAGGLRNSLAKHMLLTSKHKPHLTLFPKHFLQIHYTRALVTRVWPH